jgi:hypothetical protein
MGSKPGKRCFAYVVSSFIVKVQAFLQRISFASLHVYLHFTHSTSPRLQSPS